MPSYLFFRIFAYVNRIPPVTVKIIKNTEHNIVEKVKINNNMCNKKKELHIIDDIISKQNREDIINNTTKY